jgi:hypothetical protein
MKLIILVALLTISMNVFAEGEEPSGNVTGPDCDGAVSDGSGTKDTTPKPATDTPSSSGASGVD